MRHLTLALVIGLAGCQQSGADLEATAPPGSAHPREQDELPPLDLGATPQSPPADVEQSPSEAAPPPDPPLEVSPSSTVTCVSARIESWHARHQSRDGAWRPASFSDCCCKNLCDGEGVSDDHTVAATGLMLLAFAGGGHSCRHGAYRERVKRGIKYLKALQGPDGRIGGADRNGEAAYNHAIATWAVCEVDGLVGGSFVLRGMTENALRHLLQTQSSVGCWVNAKDRRWGDAALTVWCCLALIGAKSAGFDVPDAALVRAEAWFDWATDWRTGLVGWRQRADTGPPPDGTFWMSDVRALTAGVTAIRLLRGATLDDERLRVPLERMLTDLPTPPGEGRTDFLYWYFGTLATFRVGGDVWKTWNAGLKPAVVKTQRRGSDEDGSWDPCDTWGPVGGRVYATAINTLTLEVYYRYAYVLGGFARPPKRDPAQAR